MIYLHKILPLLVSPLTLVISLISLGIILKSKKFSIFGILILLICSIPIISNKTTAYLQKDYKYQKISQIDSADAIVVLSGMISKIKFNDNLIYEFNGAVDRIFAGIDLFKNQNAPFIILTRGKLPWSLGKPEGEYLKDFAMKFDIPAKNILLTENVQNTEQEANSVKKLLSKEYPKIILVTSAFHMSRAQKVFEANDIKIIPFAVDFMDEAQNFTFMDLIPSASSFAQTSFFIREMIGRVYYDLKY